jgi:hypothetical protein
MNINLQLLQQLKIESRPHSNKNHTGCRSQLLGAIGIYIVNMTKALLQNVLLPLFFT